MIPTPPNTFTPKPHADKWFSWVEVRACFWPGSGRPSREVNAELAPVCGNGGVYLLAWGVNQPSVVGPSETTVKYVGETDWFKRRMEGFANSAGFKGERSKGHSAGWRWPTGRREKLWVAFFETPSPQAGLPAHLAAGWRKWMEAVAIEEYCRANGNTLPPLNISADGEITLD